jgi:transposase-like protein
MALRRREDARKHMATIRQKGKILHSEWPKILAKYNSGESIAKISRDYGCTAPAIRYIVKRSGGLKDRVGGERAVGGSRSQQQASRLRAQAGGSEMPSSSPVIAAPSVMATAQHERGDRILGAELRKRLTGDVASFLVSLDQAVLDGSIESIAELQEATDRLMRSTARTRIELERLLTKYEARPAEQPSRKKSAPKHLRGA